MFAYVQVDNAFKLHEPGRGVACPVCFMHHRLIHQKQRGRSFFHYERDDGGLIAYCIACGLQACTRCLRADSTCWPCARASD